MRNEAVIKIICHLRSLVKCQVILKYLNKLNDCLPVIGISVFFFLYRKTSNFSYALHNVQTVYYGAQTDVPVLYVIWYCRDPFRYSDEEDEDEEDILRPTKVDIDISMSAYGNSRKYVSVRTKSPSEQCFF